IFVDSPKLFAQRFPGGAGSLDPRHRRYLQSRWLRTVRLSVELTGDAAARHLFRDNLLTIAALLSAAPGGPTRGERPAQLDQLVRHVDRVLAAAPEGVMRVARRMVQEEIDAHLQEGTHACLTWDGRRDRPVMGLAPRTLLGAMRLQFAQ